MRPRARDLGRRPRARARSRGDKTARRGFFGTRAHAPVLFWSRAFAGASWSCWLGTVGFYPILSGFIRFYPVLSGFIRFYLALVVGFTALSWAFVGFRGFGWVLAFSASVLVDLRPIHAAVTLGGDCIGAPAFLRSSDRKAKAERRGTPADGSAVAWRPRHISRCALSPLAPDRHPKCL